MSMTIASRATRLAMLGACGFALAGCVGPTYGTGATQGEQLLSDLDNLVSLGSTTKKADIAYQPRPDLVKPNDLTRLPPPREATSAANDPNWPVSPEVQRARRLAAAQSTAGDGALPADYRTGVQPPAGGNTRLGDSGSWVDPRDLSRQGRQAKTVQATQYGTPDQRRYLSEPPTAYRQPAASAPVGDQGVDEEVKQRRAGGTKTLGSRIRDALPF
ncbi:hypothetical protein [Aureimonas frigidaquae]|uniref:hypothetical protein n=1 Tax=Aureimonas frigidaquae TaxID=424757 RepID=UPI0007856D60|nr:hypothetical protein [Aureimonas frigidaquae]